MLSLVGAHIQASILHADLDLQLRLETAMTGALAEPCCKFVHGPSRFHGSRLFCGSHGVQDIIIAFQISDNINILWGNTFLDPWSKPGAWIRKEIVSLLIVGRG